jgi:hypothetical protein
MSGLGSPESYTDEPQAVAELAKLQTMLSESARRLMKDAELAPHEVGARELLSVASEDEKLSRRVLSVLVASGGPAPLLTEVVPDAGLELNHWKRLCRGLEAHSQLRNGIEQVRRRAAQASPELTALLQVVGRQEADHIRRLRDLIARADSLGLD